MNEEELLQTIYEKNSKIKILETQIEKMKCCENCKYQIDLEYGEKDCKKNNPCGIKYEEWELEE